MTHFSKKRTQCNTKEQHDVLWVMTYLRLQNLHYAEQKNVHLK